MEKVKIILNYVFGTNQKIRFKRILLTLVIILLASMAFLNISCGVDKVGNWYIKWQPGAKIEISR
jgi:hypothetical protein